MGRTQPGRRRSDAKEFYGRTLTPGDDFLARFATTVEGLASGTLRTVDMRALNHVGAKAYTAVKRALVQQTSLPRAIVEQGRHDGARDKLSELEFRIVGKGNRLPLRLFARTQFCMACGPRCGALPGFS
jgi:hypothetical protein